LKVDHFLIKTFQFRSSALVIMWSLC